LSSTSLTVRKIWNGQQVIRQSVNPVTIEVIYKSLKGKEDEDEENQDWESEGTADQQPNDQQAGDQPDRDSLVSAVETYSDDDPVCLVSDALKKGLHFVKSNDLGRESRTSRDIELQGFSSSNLKTD
jgi:hypothetical protein